MHSLQTFTLPRLLLDTISCLWVAHDHVDPDLKRETRHTIMSLRQVDVTDTGTAASMLRDLTPHLMKIESKLHALNRPFTAKKVRGVVNRVKHVTSGYQRISA